MSTLNSKPFSEMPPSRWFGMQPRSPKISRDAHTMLWLWKLVLGQESFLQVLPTQIDPSHTLVIMGSRAVLKRAPVMIQMMSQHREHTQKSNGHDLSLEDFLDQKMGDFVKGMHNGAAKNLHPMLISAVERPLISSALRETQGNQIQAAELLGLNRNTLRKKITNLHIPLKRGRVKTTGSS